MPSKELTKPDQTIPAPKDLFGEFAWTGDSLDVITGPAGVLAPWNYGILKSLVQNLDAFDGVLQDTQVQTTLAQRRLALIGKNLIVTPGAEDTASKKAADWMRELVASLLWDDITDKMLYGVFFGFSVAELMYFRDGSHIAVDRIIVRKRNRFRFDLSGNLRLINRQNVFEGEIMPPSKFWTFATGGDNHENPYGIGLAHWLYWPTFFKNKGIKFWCIFLDKFAMPTALGQHNFSSDKTKIGELVKALEAIHTDSGVAIPEGVTVTLLEAVRSGTTDYSTFSAYMDQAISKVVVGQTMTVDDGSSRSQADVHLDVRQDLIAADSDLINESWNRGPGRWLTAWNFPGATPPVISRELEPPEDLKTRADRDKTISDMGFKPTLDYITETYGEGFEEKQAIEPGAIEGIVEDPQFAAPRILPPEDALDQALTIFLSDDEGLNRQTAQIIEPVFAMVHRVGPEMAISRLVELYPRISHKRLTEALARVQFTAETWGRLSAESDA